MKNDLISTGNVVKRHPSVDRMRKPTTIGTGRCTARSQGKVNLFVPSLQKPKGMLSKSTANATNKLAAQIVAETTGQVPAKEDLTKSFSKATNPAAVALGHLGGLKGGPVRAKNLSSKKRKSIAQKAAKARWRKK